MKGGGGGVEAERSDGRDFRIVLRGYDPRQVDRLIDELNADRERLARRLRLVEARLASLEPRPASSPDASDAVATLTVERALRRAGERLKDLDAREEAIRAAAERLQRAVASAHRLLQRTGEPAEAERGRSSRTPSV